MSSSVKFFSFVSVLSLFLSPVYGRNQVHNPSLIFEPHPYGRAVQPRHTTKSAPVHARGISGTTRFGRPLTVAIIDTSFHPSHTKTLKDKGVIHPAAFHEHFVLDPDECTKPEFTSAEHWNLRRRILYDPLSAQEKDDLQQRIRRGVIRNQRRIMFNSLKLDDTHGSGVMDAVHLMAPRARLLPIDLCAFYKYDMDGNVLFYDSNKQFEDAVRRAIAHQVDAINLSRKFQDLSQSCLDALREAMGQGIVVVTSAGNDSSSTFRYRIRQQWDPTRMIITDPSKKQQLFNTVQGRNILFAGSLDYSPDGEEQISTYSHLADAETNRRFLLAAGERLPIRAGLGLKCGTSFAAPVLTGGFLLLKQHVLDRGYAYGSPDALLDILHESGHRVNYKDGWYGPEETFRSLNVDEALRLSDQRFAPGPQPLGRGNRPSLFVLRQKGRLGVSAIPTLSLRNRGQFKPLGGGRRPAPLLLQRPVRSLTFTQRPGFRRLQNSRPVLISLRRANLPLRQRRALSSPQRPVRSLRLIQRSWTVRSLRSKPTVLSLRSRSLFKPRETTQKSSARLNSRLSLLSLTKQRRALGRKAQTK